MVHGGAASAVACSCGGGGYQFKKKRKKTKKKKVEKFNYKKMADAIIKLESKKAAKRRPKKRFIGPELPPGWVHPEPGDAAGPAGMDDDFADMLAEPTLADIERARAQVYNIPANPRVFGQGRRARDAYAPGFDPGAQAEPPSRVRRTRYETNDRTGARHTRWDSL